MNIQELQGSLLQAYKDYLSTQNLSHKEQMIKADGYIEGIWALANYMEKEIDKDMLEKSLKFMSIGNFGKIYKNPNDKIDDKTLKILAYICYILKKAKELKD